MKLQVETMNIPINHFDRSKPFYPLVVSYVLQLLGLKEIIVRGLVGKRVITAEDIKGYTSDGSESSLQLQKTVATQLNQLLGPLELRSEQDDNTITIDADQLAQELINNHNYLLPHYILVGSNILVLAHETTKGASYRDKGHLWEFLFHCRNAVAHGGRFHFMNNQPKHPASWGKFNLTNSVHGLRLFKDSSGDGLLSPGDPIRLLWDIEQNYPDMQIENSESKETL